MKRFLLLLPLALCACSVYSAVDPANPPAGSAYNAEVGCRLATDPVGSWSADFGAIGALASAAYHENAHDNPQAMLDACMRSKGFARRAAN